MIFENGILQSRGRSIAQSAETHLGLDTRVRFPIGMIFLGVEFIFSKTNSLPIIP